MASKKSTSVVEDEFTAVENEEISDPFALDFFSQAKVEPEADESDEQLFDDDVTEAVELVPERSWSADLPQITFSEIGQSLILSHLPIGLPVKICELVASTLSQIILQNSAVVSCEHFSTVETDFSEELIRFNDEQIVALNFVVEPQQNAAVVILDADFAVHLVETALSSQVSLGERRELSRTELAVLEFFALNCLKQINDYLGEPLFRWRTVEQGTVNLTSKRGLLSKIKFQIGSGQGIVHVLLAFDFLQNLNESNNVLLREREKSKNKIARFAPFLSGIRLHPVLGETTINAADLAALEGGDVLLIENPFVNFNNFVLTGAIRIRVADEKTGSLYGDLINEERIQFLLREVSQSNKNDSMRVMMPDNQQPVEEQENDLDNAPANQNDSEDEGESALALEKVTINIAVELVSRRINLDELANIRIGQIIELGSRATDPVELVASGRTVAIGELVDVEGSLGVRLTRILL